MKRAIVAFVVVFSTCTANADGLLDYISNQPPNAKGSSAIKCIFCLISD